MALASGQETLSRTPTALEDALLLTLRTTGFSTSVWVLPVPTSSTGTESLKGSLEGSMSQLWPGSLVSHLHCYHPAWVGAQGWLAPPSTPPSGPGGHLDQCGEGAHTHLTYKGMRMLTWGAAFSCQGACGLEEQGSTQNLYSCPPPSDYLPTSGSASPLPSAVQH